MTEFWIILVVVLLVVGAFGAGAFVASTYLRARAITKGSYAWPSLRCYLHETLCTYVTQSLWPMGWFVGEGFGRRGAAPAGRPIVLIHGWTQNRTNFFWLARFLRKRGMGPFFGFNYFSLQPIETSAKALAVFVERVVAHTGAKEVDLICHSLGGLVARTYVDLMGGHRYVQRVVTLGTPHCGISYADARFGPGVRDMHSETGFVVQLGNAPLPDGVRYLSIYSTHDNIVYPGSASCLGSRGTDIMVSGFGHFGILFCEEVAAHVHRALTDNARQEEAAPRASDSLSVA
jgi:triacylglycerol esterase/lipase EstA (alpha/beta hydrolase family)